MLREFSGDQGRVSIIIGPVKSGKTTSLETALNSASAGGILDGPSVLVVKHPADDNKADHIGKHRVTVADTPDEIVNMVMDAGAATRTIIIAGIAHYEAPEIVDLLDALARSGRHVIGSALNLDRTGKPYKHLPQIIALADQVYLKAAICTASGCGSESANRSKLIGKEDEPRCAHHYMFESSPPITKGSGGSLELYLGPMFGSKSTLWHEQMTRFEHAGLEYAVFKSIKDTRGGNSVVMHNETKIAANPVGNADDIAKYLRENKKVRVVFIDEAQFIEGIYDLVYNSIFEGYKFIATGLPRGFNRKPFGEVSALMCLANEIVMLQAYCCVRGCNGLGTDNQRFKLEGKRKVPVSYTDPLVMPGGGESYGAVCLRHWVLKDEPPLMYSFLHV